MARFSAVNFLTTLNFLDVVFGLRLFCLRFRINCGMTGLENSLFFSKVSARAN